MNPDVGSEMSTLVIFEAKIKPGLSERAAQIMVEQLPDTRGFEGCQGILCYWERQVGTSPTSSLGDSKARQLPPQPRARTRATTSC